MAEFKFQVPVSHESKFEPCCSSGNHARRLFQKKIEFEGFDCKVNHGLAVQDWSALLRLHIQVGSLPVSDSDGKLEAQRRSG